MPEGGVRLQTFTIHVDKVEIEVTPGTLVASALLAHGLAARRSRTGQPRGALCGMGICYECRAEVNGVAHQRTCMVSCTPGMEVRTG
jgi:hypothetical protein